MVADTVSRVIKPGRAVSARGYADNTVRRVIRGQSKPNEWRRHYGMPEPTAEACGRMQGRGIPETNKGNDPKRAIHDLCLAIAISVLIFWDK